MKLIRRAVALTAATAIAALITVTASACGGATTTTGTPTNGLERKSAAEVLQAATAALVAAKSVHIVGTNVHVAGGQPSANLDARMQGGSSTGTITPKGVKLEFTIIGSDAYAKIDQAGLKILGAPQAVQRHDGGRWLKVKASDFNGLTLASFAPQLTTYYGPLEPKVRQATLNGRKVVVVSYREGSKLYIANTGPAYPLRAQYSGQIVSLFVFTDYGAPFHITAPSNAIDFSNTF